MHDNQYKLPISVLVVIYTPTLDVLLLERADKASFWQSVTGSLDTLEESITDAAIREVFEETGIDIKHTPNAVLHNWHYLTEYPIYPHWRYRYAPHISHNTEHWFSLEVPLNTTITLAPREHVNYLWLPYQEAARRCFSPSNAQAILALPHKTISPK